MVGEFFVSSAILLIHLMRFIAYPAFWLIYYRKPPSIPPIKNPLLKLSATTVAKKIRDKEISSQTIVEAYIKRIKEVNPFLNAVVEERFEEALEDAKMCDERIKSGKVNLSLLETEKPLYGIPVTIKESCSLKGMSYTGGVVRREHVKAADDGTAVKLLKNAGAIPLLVSNTSELCTALESFNNLFGSTLNPYDRRKTSGGSSGGEAALAGAGASILGIGSDLAGSIRIPAAFCGVFGHKPSPGITPLTGHLPWSEDHTFQQFLVIGPLARYADDLHLAMKVLSAKCEKPLRLNDPVDLKNLRVFYMDNIQSIFGIRGTSSEIRQTVHKIIHYISERGAQVEQLSQDWFHDIQYVALALLRELDIPYLLNVDNPEKKKNSIFELVKSFVGLSQHTSTIALMQFVRDKNAFLSSSKIEHYQNFREDLHRRLNSKLKDNGILVCPTYNRVADFPQLMTFGSDANIYCAYANMLRLPSTHIPIGLTKNGLPIGIQVISALDQDYITLAVARELEKAFGGWIPPS